mgnify:CR=1 FL=1
MIERERLRQIFRLGLPIMGGMLSQSLLNLIDAAMVGHLGQTSLAGVGIGSYANFIAAKGKNEFGGNTAAETNIDMQVMYDVSPHIGAAAKTFKVGLEYQYWRNKFGNHAYGNGVEKPGIDTDAPTFQMEWHF